MARYACATWRPIPEQQTQPGIRPTQVIVHRQDGLGSPRNWYERAGVVVESHFWVGQDGRVEQYLDTWVRADANLQANRRPDGTGAISVEFEGYADRVPTDAQLRAGSALLAEARLVDGVPLEQCPGPDYPGVGWHVMWGAPGPWCPEPKTCPGQAMIGRIPGMLAAARQEVWSEMATKDEVRQVVDEALAAALSAGNSRLVNAVRVAVQAELGDENAGEFSRRVRDAVVAALPAGQGPVDPGVLAAKVADELGRRIGGQQ